MSVEGLTLGFTEEELKKQEEYENDVKSLLYQLRNIQKKYVDALDEDYNPKECHQHIVNVLLDLKPLLMHIELKNAIRRPDVSVDDYFKHDEEWFGKLEETKNQECD